MKTNNITFKACSCKRCQLMCMNSPCLGSPNDIKRLIKLGHKDNMSLTIWAVGYMNSNGQIPPIEMIQLKGNPNGLTPYTRTCVMFENGLCSIHENKPTGGKLAQHDDTQQQVLERELSIAKLWLNKDGFDLVQDFKNNNN